MVREDYSVKNPTALGKQIHAADTKKSFYTLYTELLISSVATPYLKRWAPS